MTAGTFPTDQRYSPGSSKIEPGVFREAVAAYSGRWIRNHDGSLDMVPDRQGLAWNTEPDRMALLDLLAESDIRGLIRAQIECVKGSPEDTVHAAGLQTDTAEGYAFARVAGGYVYVDAVLFEDGPA